MKEPSWRAFMRRDNEFRRECNLLRPLRRVAGGSTKADDIIRAYSRVTNRLLYDDVMRRYPKIMAALGPE